MLARNEKKFSNLRSAVSRKEVKFNSDNIFDLSFAPIKYIQSMKLLLKKNSFKVMDFYCCCH